MMEGYSKFKFAFFRMQIVFLENVQHIFVRRLCRIFLHVIMQIFMMLMRKQVERNLLIILRDHIFFHNTEICNNKSITKPGLAGPFKE